MRHLIEKTNLEYIYEMEHRVKSKIMERKKITRKIHGKLPGLYRTAVSLMSSSMCHVVLQGEMEREFKKWEGN